MPAGLIPLVSTILPARCLTLRKMAGLLVRQGVEIGPAISSFEACGKSYQAGSLVINTAFCLKRGGSGSKNLTPFSRNEN